MAWHGAFAELCGKTHTEQAKWWLNGFWEEKCGKDQADKIWGITHKFIELDVGFPILYGSRMKEYTEGCDLDEIKSHHILEKLGETMTVLELRKHLKALDIDNNKRMALSEYLLDHYKKTPEELVNAPQGNIDPAEIKAAEDAFAAASAALDQAAHDKDAAAAALEAARVAAADAAEKLAAAKAAASAAADALAEAQATAAAAAAALAAAQAAASEAASKLAAATAAAQAAAEALAAAQKAAEEAASKLAAAVAAEEAAASSHAKIKAATDKVKEAEAELQASIDEISKLEKEKADKIAACDAIINDPDKSTVKKGGAVQQKAALESEDEMPMRRAKITQSAALKKVEKARVAAQAEEDAAADVMKASHDAAEASAVAKANADAAEAASAAAKSAADAAEAESASAKAAADAAEADSAAKKAAADDAEAASAAAKQAADEAEKASEQAKVQAEATFAASEIAVAEAEAQLTELKKGSGTPNGNIYWMERTLVEKKKFMK